MPTPAGVPVAIRSPGWSVMPALMVSISVGTSKIRSDTGASCRFSPLTWVVRRSAPGSGTSSAVRMAGPIGQKPSMPLPRIHCRCLCWSVRAVTSLTTV